MIYEGLFTTQAEDLMEDISLALVEPIVNTTLGTTIAHQAQTATVTPGSMAGIYLGAILLIDFGSIFQEQIAVTAVTPITFTANFTNPHSSTALVVGATFPSGQTDHPLFTQNEIMGYITDTQNDFLLKTRSIYGVSAVPVSPGNRFYTQPIIAIRVERIADLTTGMDLLETTQSDLDFGNFAWTADARTPLSQWFRDQIDSKKFGLYPIPVMNGSVELWYSQRSNDIFFLTDQLSVPDVVTHYIKYGVLAKCWSKDGESHNPLRSEYCQKRFDFGVEIVNRYMEGIGIQAQLKQKPSVSPMVIASPAEVTGG